METPANLRHSIQKGDWVISVDLTDAYLHVPIHQLSRKFLRFCYQDEVFQFRVLPFGLSVSLRVFTRVVDAMMAHVRSLGFQVHHYPDDWLLRNQQLAQLRTQTQGLLHLTTRLGWIPSLEKSELTPTQDFVFIGTHYRTDLGLMFPPAVQFPEAASHARRFLLTKYVTSWDFLSLLGRLVSMSDLVPLGRLRYWPLQLYLLAHWQPSQGQLSDWMPLDHPFLDPFLKWWTKPSDVQGRPIQAPPPQLAIYTDASTSGWGAHCSNQSAAGLLSATETSRHINELEMLAIQKAVLHFLPLIRGKVVMIHSDNSSAVHLFAWSLSRVACESFQKQLPTVSARQLEHLPLVSMTVNGECMRVGVVQNRLVLFNS